MQICDIYGFVVGVAVGGKMQNYKDKGGDSGISAYEVASDSIIVKFKHGGIFLYTYASAGSNAVEKMKQLAAKGDGLNTYINKYVKNRYASRLR